MDIFLLIINTIKVILMAESAWSEHSLWFQNSSNFQDHLLTCKAKDSEYKQVLSDQLREPLKDLKRCRSKSQDECHVGIFKQSKKVLGYVYTPGIGSHKVYTEPKNWTDAFKTCENEDAHLAIINSQDEANLFRKLVSDSDKKSYELYTGWIGVHDLFGDGIWRNIFGQSITFTNWNTTQDNKQVNQYNNENCGSLYFHSDRQDDDVKMENRDCNTKMAFVCEHYEKCLSNFPYKTKIFSGYKTTPGVGSHKIYDEPQTWTEAIKTCQKDNAHLAIINSQEEANLFRDLLSYSVKQKIRSDLNGWIGMSDLFLENDWRDIFGQPIEFSHWRTSDTYNYQHNGRCGVLHLSLPNYYANITMMGWRCDDKLSFICELHNEVKVDMIQNEVDSEISKLSDFLEPSTSCSKNTLVEVQALAISLPMVQTELQRCQNILAETWSDYQYAPEIGYYKIHAEEKTWLDAERSCIEEGAHLVVVNSQIKNDFLYNLLATSDFSTIPGRFPSLWVGTRWVFDNSSWITILDEPMSSKFWGIHNGMQEPDENYIEYDEGKRCVLMYRDKDSNGLMSGKCDEVAGYVCEKYDSV